jgi:hypothetical protein
MLKTGDKIVMKKIGRPANPEFETPSWDEHEEGKVNEGTLPVFYKVKGSLLSDIEEGSSILLERTWRNGKEVQGITQSSPVQEINQITENQIEVDTLNSIYQIARQ